MSENKDALIELVKGIIQAVDKKLKDAPYDKTVRGRVTDVLPRNRYKVSINGQIYTVKSKSQHTVHDIVNVMMPQNNTNEMFIIADGFVENGTSQPTYIHPDTHSLDMITETTGKKIMTSDERNKLANIEASAEVNNISDANAIDLTDKGDSTLHYHSTDRDRINHTGTQTANTISDFASSVRNTALTGLSTITNVAISATDSVLSALGKLQKQISDNLNNMQTALNNKSDANHTHDYIPNTEKGIIGGVATLGSDGLITSNQLPSNLKEIKVVDTIIDRDALTQFEGLRVHVIDATSDITVSSGWAEYLSNGTMWTKTAEKESIDVSLEWNNISGKPNVELKADIDSPVLTGTPTAPTASNGTNTTQIATTAFVQQEMGASGLGDMRATIYDTDGDGIVNKADSAIKLDTAVNINGIPFDGSANITITANPNTHNHVVADVTDFPTSLPANGGNADTVDGKHANDFEPYQKLADYSKNVADLPNTYPIGSSITFVSANEGWFSFGTVVTDRGHGGGGGTCQVYTPYGTGYGGTTQRVRFGNYNVSAGNSWTTWKTVGDGCNADTVDGFNLVSQTTIPTTLATNTICYVYE